MQAAIAQPMTGRREFKRISGHATACSFRRARISERLQIYGVDPSTVAPQKGASIAVIEKAYLPFILSAAQEKRAAMRHPVLAPMNLRL